MSRGRTAPRLPRVWLAGLLALALASPTGLADDRAELMPLAKASLLLDADIEGRRVIAVGERGHVLLSDDRGASWRQADVPTRSALTAVQIVGGGRVFAVAYDDLVLRSDDGGHNWSAQRVLSKPDRPLLDLRFADPEHGVVIGAYGLVLATADGGRTWRRALDDENRPHANAIAAAPDGTLYIVGEAGWILRSGDRGETWQELPSPYAGSLFGVLALDDATLLAFGLRGHLFRSEDRATSWRQLPTGTAATLLAGLLRADGSIVLAGLGGAFLVSDDGGRSFELRQRADRSGIAALVELGPNQLLTVGEGGLRRIFERSPKAPARTLVDVRQTR
jgi:photosystem II stability/assembly factor-like uncharacterized protein